MSAQLIDGTELSKSMLADLKGEVRQVAAGLGRPPHLAVVLVGENPASKVYVASKSKKARACGMAVKDLVFPASISDAELQAELHKLSADPELDGILLQLPLPSGLNEFQALLAIDPAKDVDGLHPFNQGLLLRGAEGPIPCTPLGCLRLIEAARRQLGQPPGLEGLHAVVVGRSVLVGKPMSALLLNRSCTVTVCHSRTRDLEAECRRSDIVVAAIGRPRQLTAAHIKPGAIVIDVGINRLADGTLVGDVDFASAQQTAAAITPVPGGVGPMTIAMLLQNTVTAARKKVERPASA